MLIDWFTVGAQILNFLILVWLMKRFLYQPILNAIDARENLIAQKLADAQITQQQADQKKADFEQKIAHFDAQHTSQLRAMHDTLQTEREQLLKDAREAADDLAATRRILLQKEASTLAQDLQARVQEQVFGIARQALTELAGIELQHALVLMFLKKLQGLASDSRTKLAKALCSSHKTANSTSSPPSPAVVRSAFDLTQDQQKSIRDGLNTVFSADIDVVFDTTPTLIGGIELLANGQKLTWSIANYLLAMEQQISELFKPPQSSVQSDHSVPQSQTEHTNNKSQAQTNSDIAAPSEAQ